MDCFNFRYGSLMAVLAGIGSHVFYFRIGEHHMYAPLYVLVFLATCIAATAALSAQDRGSLLEASQMVAALAGSWLFGVYSSLLVYRMMLHPLRKFPGPWRARISKFHFMSLLGKHDAYHQLNVLHEKYGRYVRIGPNDLSIIDPDFTFPTSNADSPVMKGDWYDLFHPNHSMHSVRDKNLHARRRRYWAPAFSERALRDYETLVRKCNDAFMLQVKEHQGTPMNTSKWGALHSFDVMGRLVLGKDYRATESGERHWSMTMSEKAQGTFALRPPIWFVRLAICIPGMAANFQRYLNFCVNELRTRLEKPHDDNKTNDIMGWILKIYGEDRNAWKDPFLQGDTRLIIIAGSEATGVALAFLLYRLAADPTQVTKLRAELASIADTYPHFEDKHLQQHAPLLQGAINEALRIHPPIPSGLSRVTPRQGLRVNDVYIPGGVNFIMPQYPMGRDEANYERATEFIPERWTSRPEMIRKPDAFAPFSHGPTGCIGRKVAMMEIRTLVAEILLKYDLRLAPGEDGYRIERETRDTFTIFVGDCDVIFTPVANDGAA